MPCFGRQAQQRARSYTASVEVPWDGCWQRACEPPDQSKSQQLVHWAAASVAAAGKVWPHVTGQCVPVLEVHCGNALAAQAQTAAPGMSQAEAYAAPAVPAAVAAAVVAAVAAAVAAVVMGDGADLPVLVLEMHCS